MTNPVIRVENLGKYYRLGVIGGGTLREDVSRWWARRRDKPDPYSQVGSGPKVRPKSGQVWALKNVNVEVYEGEILGIIGRNGAGKSTLLKVLSRITAPTSGRAIIKGRVGSLLEVGTGFHPELTGRENIYLNGAILGMRRAEVTRKLEEIVDFAEVDKFVDTPVKRYSSGMLVRLAFAVAAHLDPEVMIVDEVLAVGDIGFQNKCLGKMQDVTRNEARTVVFVSHNMASIEALCDRVALIDGGSVAFDGEVRKAVSRYNAMVSRETNVRLEDRTDRKGDGVVKLIDCYFTGPDSGTLDVLSTGKEVSIRIPYRAKSLVNNVRIGLNLYESTGSVLINFNCVDSGGELRGIPTSGEFVCTIPRFPLRQGRYFGNISCFVNGCLSDWIERAFVVDVADGDYFGTGSLVSQGKFVAENYWHVSRASDTMTNFG